jgi:release factor glutamine methyltransferase
MRSAVGCRRRPRRERARARAESEPTLTTARKVTGTPAHEALDSAIVAITAAGCETPRLDAEILLAHTLGVTREQLLLDRELLVAGPAVRAFQDAVRRRAVEREPVAYIVGRRGFRRLDLAVDPRALVPRPETEMLVELGLRLAAGAAVLDLGARAQGRAPRPPDHRQ